MTVFRLVERYLRSDATHADPVLWEINAYRGLPLDYPTARRLLVAEESRRPELHVAGARTYLSVEPVGGAR